MNKQYKENYIKPEVELFPLADPLSVLAQFSLELDFDEWEDEDDLDYV